MAHRKNKITMLSTLAVLTLCPALVVAQTAPAPGDTSGSTDVSRTTPGSGPTNGTQGSTQGSQHQGSGASQGGTDASTRSNSTGMSGAQSQPSLSIAQQSIDPSAVQKVFGTDASLVDLRSLGTGEIEKVQQALQERGHYRGRVDGIFGPQTRAALNALLAEQYALNQRLINQGQIAGQLASSLGMDVQAVSPVNGVDLSSDRAPSPRSGIQRSNATGTTGASSPSGSSGSQRSTSPSPSGTPHYPSTSGSGSSTAPNTPR